MIFAHSNGWSRLGYFEVIIVGLSQIARGFLRMAELEGVEGLMSILEKFEFIMLLVALPLTAILVD